MKNLLTIIILLTSFLANAQSILPQMYTGKRPYTIMWQDTLSENQTSLLDSARIHTWQILEMETYTGSTDSAGDYSVIFPTSYTTVPFVKASIPNQSSPNQFLRVSSVSQTGFTVNAYGFDTLGNALQIDTTPIQSLTISVFVAE